MKKRSGRKSQKPPPAGRPPRRPSASPGVGQASSRAPALQPALHYKVVELSSVDEGALERTLNEWVRRGWTFEAVQFAMRESSKRPAMAFVFFTREGEPAPERIDEARERLWRLAQEDGSPKGLGASAEVLEQEPE